MKERSYLFDNLKGFLIICVIIGNSLEFFEPHSIDFHFFILLLYTFHMPVFAFISGYFYKKSSRTTKQLSSKTIILFVSFQLFYIIFNSILDKSDTLDIQLFYPQWTLWYLITLSALYVICDYVKKPKLWLVYTFTISLLIGFDKSVGTYLSISRTFFFLPIFILGMMFKIEYINTIKRYLKYITPLTIILLTLLYYFNDKIPVDVFFEYTYYNFHFDNEYISLIFRFYHYIMSFMIGSILLCIVPNKKTSLSYLGKNSLLLYLSHSGIIKVLYKCSLLKYNNLINSILSEILILSITIVVSIVVKNLIESFKIGYRKKITLAK